MRVLGPACALSVCLAACTAPPVPATVRHPAPPVAVAHDPETELAWTGDARQRAHWSLRRAADHVARQAPRRADDSWSRQALSLLPVLREPPSLATAAPAAPGR